MKASSPSRRIKLKMAAITKYVPKKSVPSGEGGSIGLTGGGGSIDTGGQVAITAGAEASENDACSYACLRFVMAKHKPLSNWQTEASRGEVQAVSGGCAAMCSTFLSAHRRASSGELAQWKLPNSLTQKVGREAGRIISQHASL